MSIKITTAIAAIAVLTAGPAFAQDKVNGIDLNPIKEYRGKTTVPAGVPSQEGKPTETTPGDWHRTGDKLEASERERNQVSGEKPDKPADWWKTGQRTQ